MDKDPLATAVAILTIHAGWRAVEIDADRPSMPVDRAPEDALTVGLDDADLLAIADDLHAATAPGLEERARSDGELILDLIGRDASPEDVGELIVALGMLGAILAEEAGDASGRPASAVLRELALRYAA
ncbi:MAG TPA: hypothetical protein VGP02_00725 [Mycobacteriales bacterium]|nr:hypothetical protein [Mycobacteriales bacterium]